MKKCKKSRPDKQIIVPETIGYDIDINLSNGRKISFTNASNVIEGEYGLWIETPLSGKPEFTAENNYYEENPFSAYEFNSFHATVYKEDAHNELVVRKNQSGRIPTICFASPSTSNSPMRSNMSFPIR